MDGWPSWDGGGVHGGFLYRRQRSKIRNANLPVAHLALIDPDPQVQISHPVAFLAVLAPGQGECLSLLGI
jgi:hypothetical protein